FQYVQDEIARRKELGPLANKSLNISCFTRKIKCPYCGQSYIHCKRKPKNEHCRMIETWTCGSKKKKGGNCPVGGSINQDNMKKALAEVLRTPEFDEEVFTREVERIDIPAQYTLEIHFYDGRVITKDCPNTGHRDCWTEEYRARTSEKRRDQGTNPKGGTALTGKIKCVDCGCNFRRSTQQNVQAGGYAHYWRCAEHGRGCMTTGMREDLLKPLLAEAIGEPEYSEEEFSERLDHIDVYEGGRMEIFLNDGSVATAQYTMSRWDRLWTMEEQKKMREDMVALWTPERRARQSEVMKQVRKERSGK
ncbi:MAG: zinc ribbon domain-containing protein, partial [Clostridiales bacterium]|nr:zinc ribbon domain-containing protein [Clostridiales bacterium]